MNFDSKKISLVLLGITSILGSRAMFAFLNDPEGPNLPIVMATSLFVYLVSLAAYFFSPAKSLTSSGRLVSVICAQITLVTGLYFLLA